ncbi:MAG: protein-glutamate O-methyltransferase CheR [Desulfarculaceae bacterium]|nr:protein-glutamate O-methyltransferase CheR [Desulfarculaceae bacterium]MCF8072332.1 protein-glutamate O-methyltransferase CheR [Desulfarculaceae bacterium]MCF8100253.1 protein-glutamate O-methyltransferase CheR [Desulfarculaceae bacterium]MCF8116174.1 protein-glutamate O-methyltransferase CheR [Desulfarculaceae bacterium]
MPPETKRGAGSLPPGPFALSGADFQAIRALVKQRAGISLGPGKKDLVVSRLSRRLRALDLSSFSQYVALLRSEQGEAELVEMVNQITTNQTDFFREQHHFDFLRDQALPAITEAGPPRTVRAWSAGCSSGQEPYSMALVLAEHLAARPGWQARILATDLHTDRLRRASLGQYQEEEVGRLPRHLLLKHFQRGREQGRTLYQARPGLRAMITFGKLNLMERHYPRPASMDFIFCRNVLIYFEAADKAAIVKRLEACLRPGGWLFLGHSESLLADGERYACVGPTMYRKR